MAFHFDLSVENWHGQDVNVLILEGDLDAAEVHDLAEKLNLAFVSEPLPWAIYAFKLKYISSAGIGQLFKLSKHAKETISKLCMVGTTPQIHKVLNMVGLEDQFTQFEAIDEAKRRF